MNIPRDQFLCKEILVLFPVIACIDARSLMGLNKRSMYVRVLRRKNSGAYRDENVMTTAALLSREEPATDVFSTQQ